MSLDTERELIATIAVDIDTNLDILSCKNGVKMPEHKIRSLDYNQVYDKAVRQIYYVIAGRGCPEFEKVIKTMSRFGVIERSQRSGLIIFMKTRSTTFLRLSQFYRYNEKGRYISVRDGINQIKRNGTKRFS